MPIVKRNVAFAVCLSYAVLWVLGVGLNDWRLRPFENPASLAVFALAHLIVAGVALAVLTSDRTFQALAAPETDSAQARLSLWIL